MTVATKNAETWGTLLAAQFDSFTSPTGEHLYRTAVIRQDIGWKSISGMRPGEKVYIRYWKHEYDTNSRRFKPIYFMAKTADFAYHFSAGSFSTVYNNALEYLTT